MASFESDLVVLCESLTARLATSDRRIVAVTMVRNESDVVERFVRHTLTWADFLLVVDHASVDETSVILRQLADEGLSLAVLRDDAIAFHQADRMTLLARAAARYLAAHVVVPLDADEFLVSEEGTDLKRKLMQLPSDVITFAVWKSYVPTPTDDGSERDVLKRITYRLRNELSGISKAIVGGGIAAKSEFRLLHGAHMAFNDGLRFERRTLTGQFRLAHFPIRSAGQITAKAAIQELARSAEHPSDAAVHYKWLRTVAPIHSYMPAQDLQRIAECYALYEPAPSPGLALDPVPDASGPLRYTRTHPVDAASLLEGFARQILNTTLSNDQAYKETTTLWQTVWAENEGLRSSLNQANINLNQANINLEKISQSLSWRVTAPFRAFERFARRFLMS